MLSAWILWTAIIGNVNLNMQYFLTLYIYMDQKMELESQWEQSRLLNDSPKVIPEVVSTKPSEELEDSSRKDKRERNGLPELVLGEACSPPGNHSNGSNPAVNNRTDATGLPCFSVSPSFSHICV